MAKKKVLVVDDEETISRNLKEMLEMRDCEAFMALDTVTAWELFQKEQSQVCIIDIHMFRSPFDGVELLRKIRQIDQKVKCVILSCVDEKQRRDEINALGVTAYYEKPLGIDLLTLINKVANEY